MKVKISVFIVVIIFILNSCSSMMHSKIEKQIEFKDNGKLTEIRQKLLLKPEKYPEHLKLLNTYFENYYAEIGEKHYNSGHIDSAIIYNQNAYSVAKNQEYILIIRKLEEEKENLDRIITYINSNNCDDYTSKFKLFKDAYRTTYPINKKVYILKKLSEEFINECQDIYNVISSKKRDDILKLIEIEKLRSSINSEINSERVNFFYNKYYDISINSDITSNRNNRLTYLELLHRGAFDKLLNVKNILSQRLTDFYSHNFKYDKNTIDDIYEGFIVNTLGYPNINFDIRTDINNYIIKNSYEFSIKDNYNKNIEKYIYQYLKKETDYNSYISKKDGKTFEVSIDIINFKTNINKKSYKKSIRSKYHIGSHEEVNQEYTRLLDELEDLKTQYIKNKNSLAYMDNELSKMVVYLMLDKITSNMKQVNSKLNRTPQFKTVNDYQNYKFTEIGHEIDGILKINVNIKYNEKVIYKIPLEKKIYKKSKSRINVVPNDYNGYKEIIETLPNELILSVMLAKDVSKKISNCLSSITDYKMYTPTTLYNYYQVKNKFKNSYLSYDFMTYFKDFEGKTENKSKSYSENKIVLNEETQKFNTLKDVVRYASNISCQIICFNNNYSTYTGTGYFITDNGYLITNNHVIDDMDYILVLKEVNGNLEIKIADLIQRNKQYDLALLKTTGSFEDSTPLTIIEKSEIEMGDETIYVGYPESPISKGSEPFTSRGIVSQVVKNDYKTPILVLFDITANKGASGSAMINEKNGELIGTLTWGFGRNISINDFVEIIEGSYVNIKESQNVGTSKNILIDFLKGTRLLE
ncbi:trypsin-like peptidase domain-containing protein [Methanococcoides sp. SA1]|nr:trypsin-like peptidase domain-containing protein [Methanococcoides sp. SA1]